MQCSPEEIRLIIGCIIVLFESNLICSHPVVSPFAWGTTLCASLVTMNQYTPQNYTCNIVVLYTHMRCYSYNRVKISIGYTKMLLRYKCLSWTWGWEQMRLFPRTTLVRGSLCGPRLRKSVCVFHTYTDFPFINLMGKSLWRLLPKYHVVDANQL